MITTVENIPKPILARMVIQPVAAQPAHIRTLTEAQINNLKTPEEIALALFASEVETAQGHIFEQLKIHVDANRLVEARSIERWDKAMTAFWTLVCAVFVSVAGAIALKYIHP